MDGDGSSDGGNREYVVEGIGEGSTRLRSSRSRKSHDFLASWGQRTDASYEQGSNNAEVEANGELRQQNSDAMDSSEAENSTRAHRSTDANGNWRQIRRDAGAGEAREVMEVSAWRNPRMDRRHRWVRNTRAAVAETSERPGLGRVADLFDSGASGSRSVQDDAAVIGFSSDEEDAGGAAGKQPVHDVIDLIEDSPVAGIRHVNRLTLDGSSTRNDEAGPSQSSGESPPRRLMQRPAFADAKRARRIMHRSAVAHPEERGVENGLTTLDVANEVEPIDDATATLPLPEPYNLRRGRSLNLGASPLTRIDRRGLTASNGNRGRVRRQNRFQPGGSVGVGFSDLNNLRRPFSVPSSSRNGNVPLLVNLDDQESPNLVAERRGNNTVVLEDVADSARARQLLEDERVARELQDSFAQEDLGTEQPPTDEMLARMLQDQENSYGRRGLPIEQRPVLFAPPGMRPLLGGNEDEREARRLFRNELAQGYVPDHLASSSRIVRRGYGRNASLNRPPNPLAAPTPDAMNGRRVQFPARMGLESRVDFLAALELAFEQYPVGLELAHLDRDFNENDYEMLLALDTDNHRHRGATLESINQLPVTTITPTDVSDEDCSICLETPVVGDVIRRLPCMHAFHQQCIDQWLQHQAVCPVCKAHILGEH